MTNATQNSRQMRKRASTKHRTTTRQITTLQWRDLRQARIKNCKTSRFGLRDRPSVHSLLATIIHPKIDWPTMFIQVTFVCRRHTQPSSYPTPDEWVFMAKGAPARAQASCPLWARRNCHRTHTGRQGRHMGSHQYAAALTLHRCLQNTLPPLGR